MGFFSGTTRRGYCLTEFGRRVAADRKNLVMAECLVAKELRRRPVLRRFAAELRMAAQEGLVDAVAHYNPNKDPSFAYYAPRRIWGHCRESLRQSRSMTPYRDVRVTSGPGRPRVHSMHRDFRPGTEAFSFVNGADTVHYAFPPDPAPSVGRDIDADDAFEAWLRGLDERDRYICREYYGRDPKTFEQIAGAIGVSPTRVRQLHERCLEHLRYRAEVIRHPLLAIA